MWGFTLNILSFHTFFGINEEEDRKILRERFGITKNEVTTKVENLQNWAKNHQWLPTKEATDIEYLEMMLMNNKFEIPRTKKKIEGIFKCATIYPEFYKNLTRNLKVSEQAASIVISPVRTDDMERIIIFRLNPQFPNESVDYDLFGVTALAMAFILRGFDLNTGVRVIFDYKSVTWQHFIGFKISTFLKLKDICLKCVSIRISGLEIINAPPFVHKIVALMTTLVGSPKLTDRITVHSSIDSLTKSIPKKFLPCDYGGELDDIQSWLKAWDGVLIEFHQVLEKISSIECDYKKDGEYSNESELHGARGTFKQLIID